MTSRIVQQYVNGLVKTSYPGNWEALIVSVKQGTRAFIPHDHGRVPDLQEIVDLSDLYLVLEALGVTFPEIPGDPGVVGVTLAGKPIYGETLVDPSDVIRQLGQPTAFIEGANGEELILLNRRYVFPIPAKADPYRFAVVSGIRYTAEPSGTIFEKLGINLDFDAEPENGNVPLDVLFRTDWDGMVYGDLFPVNFKWEYGDGSDDEGANLLQVTHTYTVPGTYTVRLTLTFADGLNIPPVVITKTDYITATP